MDKPIEMQKEKKDSTLEKIKELEEQISKTKYNKKTQHAIGLYKAQLAKLKEKQKARRHNGSDHRYPREEKSSRKTQN